MGDDIMQTFKKKVSGKFLPCPFCGRIDTLGVYTWGDIEDNYDDASDWDKTHFAVCCDVLKEGCGAIKGKECETPEQAVEEWNRRA